MSTRVPAPLPGTPDVTPRVAGRRRRTTRALVAAAVVGGMVLGAGGASWATHDFPDVPASNPFHDEISWMVDAGITGGFSDGTFKPGRSVTRAQMAAFMQRLFDLRDTVEVVSTASFVPIDTPVGTFVDVNGMTATVTVPPGTTATILARYGAETLCEDADGVGYCVARIMRGTTEMSVGHSSALSLDSVTSTGADDNSEAHMIERWATNIGPGTHTIKVQATEGNGGVTAFTLDNQTLTVQVILDPS